MPIDPSQVKWDSTDIDPNAVNWDSDGPVTDLDTLLQKERTDWTSLTPEEKRALVQYRKSGQAPKVNAATTAEAAKMAASDMNAAQKLWTGFGSTLPSIALSAQQIFGSEDNQKELTARADEMKQIQSGLGGWGAAGKGIGMAGLTAPALLIPGLNGYVGAGVAGGLIGALEPVGTGDSRLKNTGVGVATGLLGQGAGQVAGKAVTGAAKRVLNIESSVAEKAAQQAAADTASARSAAGNAAQNAYKQLEHLRELKAFRNLTPEEAQVAAELEKELASKAAEKLLPAAALKNSTAQAYREAIDTEAQRASELAAQKLSGQEIKNQIKARLLRYGPAAVGGAIGSALFPGLGTIGGAATGLVLRPALRSMINLSKNPAVQRAVLSKVANMGLLKNEALPPTLGLLAPTYFSQQ